MHAVYEEQSTRDACEQTVAAGPVPLQAVLARVDPTVVDVEAKAGEHSLCTNVNTRADMRAVTDWIES